MNFAVSLYHRFREISLGCIVTNCLDLQRYLVQGQQGARSSTTLTRYVAGAPCFDAVALVHHHSLRKPTVIPSPSSTLPMPSLALLALA